MSNSQKILEKVFRTSFTTRFHLADALKPHVMSVLGYDEIDAESYAQRQSRKFWNELTKRLDEEKLRGLYPTFEILDSSRFELMSYCSIAITDTKEIKFKKARLTFKGQVLDVLDGLNDRQYEALGCFICKIAGAKQWHLTPPGNEYGIDFLATVPAFGKVHIFPSLKNEIRIVGQSKRWGDPVPRKEVDYLANTTVEHIRRRAGRMLDLKVVPSWFLLAEGPLVGCLLGKSGFQEGAWNIANDQGVIIADNKDIAEMICLSRGWDIELGFAGLRRYIESNIAKIIHQFKPVP